jgi:hypothetical protein
VKTKKKNNEKKESQKANAFPHCGDFQKMTEMMKNFCTGESNATDCCSIIRRMMGRGKGAEVKETKETEKQSEDGKKGKNLEPTNLSSYQNERR